MSDISLLDYNISPNCLKVKLKKNATYAVTNFIKILKENEDYLYILVGINGKYGFIIEGKFMEMKIIENK